jgi:hypothetical protein
MGGIAPCVVISTAGFYLLSMDNVSEGNEAETANIGVVERSIIRGGVITTDFGAVKATVFNKGCC